MFSTGDPDKLVEIIASLKVYFWFVIFQMITRNLKYNYKNPKIELIALSDYFR